VYSPEQIAAMADALPYVVWEYWSSDFSRGRILGWIPRRDGGRDTVELFWNSAAAWVVTSSQHHVVSIGQRLGGLIASVTLDRRVEHALGDRVQRYALLQLPPPAGGGGDAGPGLGFRGEDAA
jgi:hypothetical protein